MRRRTLLENNISAKTVNRVYIKGEVDMSELSLTITSDFPITSNLKVVMIIEGGCLNASDGIQTIIIDPNNDFIGGVALGCSSSNIYIKSWSPTEDDTYIYEVYADNT